MLFARWITALPVIAGCDHMLAKTPNRIKQSPAAWNKSVPHRLSDFCIKGIRLINNQNDGWIFFLRKPAPIPRSGSIRSHSYRKVSPVQHDHTAFPQAAARLQILNSPQNHTVHIPRQTGFSLSNRQPVRLLLVRISPTSPPTRCRLPPAISGRVILAITTKRCLSLPYPLPAFSSVQNDRSVRLTWLPETPIRSLPGRMPTPASSCLP